MSNVLHDAAIAVDGGGTNCRFALDIGGPRYRVALGPANVTSDFETAIKTIRDGLARLAGEAGLAPEALEAVPAYLGLAGVVDADHAHRVAECLPLRRVTVEDDRRAAVRGALGSEDGALAGIGTGSFLAIQQVGRIRLAGGWGARLGDQASGYWIGQAVLAATLDAHDGLIERTALVQSVLTRFDERPGGIVSFAQSASPSDFAAFAPQVIDTAKAGDAVGRRIMERGSAYISETLGLMGWRPGMPVCLLGGVAASYSDYLPPDMQAASVPPRGTALDGGLELARETQGEPSQ